MTETEIHPTAIIDPKASLGTGVTIGPFCTVGANSVLGDRVTLKSHVVVEGHTTIGEDTTIFPFSVIGTAPQDLKFGGEESYLIIGKRNRIREHVTMNPGTKGGGLKTVVGDDGLFMVGVHIAHDCIVGDHVIMANNATLAGHVSVGDRTVIGGLSAVHQFVRIGKGAMIGGMSGVEADVIPYGMVIGDRANLRGLNLVGLQRSGTAKKEINELRALYKLLFSGSGEFKQRLDEAETYDKNPLMHEVLDFIRTVDSQRGLTKPI